MKTYYFKAKFSFAVILFGALFVLGSCQFGSKKNARKPADTLQVDNAVIDTTVYGTCGEGTAMHSLELITDAGDSLQYMIFESADGQQDVQGGLLVGDRLAVIEGKGLDNERVAKKVVNITTLLGKWTSLDKNFDILEDGTVRSNVKAETNPWTNWKILNGQLLLNKDTFDIVKLGKDSLYLENKQGIFTFKRP
ncbi:hypothetical protein [Hallella colorans]|uniref:hypothetical protein n=1 Tax=Hallella colorans TaxID=1703337 RepID=UPI0023F051E1|nr:hypothetical protein [Hallella colorans]